MVAYSGRTNVFFYKIPIVDSWLKSPHLLWNSNLFVYYFKIKTSSSSIVDDFAVPTLSRLRGLWYSANPRYLILGFFYVRNILLLLTRNYKKSFTLVLSKNWTIFWKSWPFGSWVLISRHLGLRLKKSWPRGLWLCWNVLFVYFCIWEHVLVVYYFITLLSFLPSTGMGNPRPQAHSHGGLSPLKNQNSPPAKKIYRQ